MFKQIIDNFYPKFNEGDIIVNSCNHERKIIKVRYFKCKYIVSEINWLDRTDPEPKDFSYINELYKKPYIFQK